MSDGGTVVCANDGNSVYGVRVAVGSDVILGGDSDNEYVYGGTIRGVDGSGVVVRRLYCGRGDTG